MQSPIPNRGGGGRDSSQMHPARMGTQGSYVTANYRNISFATAGSLADVVDQGTDVIVRGKLTRELLVRLTTLERPLERYLFLPKRYNDVFAQFAETDRKSVV